jgi:hypothetical protein
VDLDDLKKKKEQQQKISESEKMTMTAQLTFMLEKRRELLNQGSLVEDDDSDSDSDSDEFD